MDPWINAMTTNKQRKLVIGCTENMQQQQDMSAEEFHPRDEARQRPEQQFGGHEDDCYRIDSETGWKYYFSCYHHEFFFLFILMATIRQLLDSMKLGLFIMD